ncbi:MAG: twin-arginine translocase TatA/TatE family subunit [Oligoflexus sp.]|nr:twin-arginine translocase TatA/TatE family subunit [Oligoflexus sp.]
MMPGFTEMLIIAGVIVLLFGTSKLPKLGGAVGESIKNFKKGMKNEDDESQRLKDKPNDEPKS